MNVLSIKSVFKTVEPVIVVFLLLVSTEIKLLPSIEISVRMLRYLFIIFLCLKISINRLPQIVYVAGRDFFPLILVGISLISVFWSDIPAQTIDEVTPLIRDSCFGFYIAVKYTPRRQIQLFAWALGIAGFLSLLTAIVIPDYGMGFTYYGDPALIGIYKHKQYIGRLMPIGAISFLSIALQSKRWRWLPWAGFLLMLSLIWLSFSKSSIILLFISLSLLPLYQLVRQKYRLKTVLLMSLLLMVGISTILLVSNLETLLVDVLGKDIELHGRIPIWTLAIEQGLKKPLLGYGYAGFWGSYNGYLVIQNTWLVHLFAELNNDIRGIHAHNGFIEIFLQLGLVGLCCLLFSIVRLFWRTIYLINNTKNREFIWMLQIIVIIIISSLSESDSLVHRDFMWISYVSISFSIGIWFSRIIKHKNKPTTEILILNN